VSLKNIFASKPKVASQKVYNPMASLAFKFSFIFAIIALIILFLYSIGEARNAEKFLDILGVVIVIAFASLSAGGIIGFLFGIPHTIQQNIPVNTSNSSGNSNSTPAPVNNNPAKLSTPGSPTSAQAVGATSTALSPNVSTQANSNYTHSTNLEQIADWLTKIIVGVGLIQIHSIILKFNQLCLSLGATLQHYSSTNQNGSLMVGGIIITFSIEGFLTVYLWTYLYLIRIQDSMVSVIIDTINSKIEDTDLSDKYANDLVSKQLDLPDKAPDIPISDLTQAFQDASKNFLSTIFFKAVSVRKQFWKNIDTKYKIEKTIPIFQALIIVDSNFEYPENYAELAFVLKDQRTPDYKQALSNLIIAISGFNDTDRITNKAIIYFNSAYCRIKVDVNFLNKTASTPANKKLILSDLNQAVQEPYVKAIITNDPLDTTINDWKNLNP